MAILQKKEFLAEPEVYAVKHRDVKERLASQSGGMFAIISDVVLENQGVVYGCVFDRSFNAKHIRTDTYEDRNRMRYSKYVQSDMQDCFRNVSEDLNAGRNVLFSGTPCQVSGLRKYISVKCPNISGKLFTVDIVCHGVPSPLVWRDYLRWEKEKKQKEISEVICRNKSKYGWKSHVVSISFSKGCKVYRRVFPRLFYSHVILRPSCYKCPYKDTHRESDITIADYWGIDKASPGFKDDKGVSLVLVNTSNGVEMFDKCKTKMIYKQTKIENSLQKPLIEPYECPKNRVEFWNDYKRKCFDDIARQYGHYSLKDDLEWKAKYSLKRWLHITR